MINPATRDTSASASAQQKGGDEGAENALEEISELEPDATASEVVVWEDFDMLSVQPGVDSAITSPPGSKRSNAERAWKKVDSKESVAVGAAPPRIPTV